MLSMRLRSRGQTPETWPKRDSSGAATPATRVDTSRWRRTGLAVQSPGLQSHHHVDGDSRLG